MEVEFIAKLDAGGAVIWEADGKPAKDHKIPVKKFDRPQKIKIKIKADSSAKPLDLKIDSSNPFQVAPDTGACPGEGINTDQIEVLSCDSDSITINDLNTGDACVLRYQVNVVDKAGTSWPCDPIIENGGAGPGHFI